MANLLIEKRDVEFVLYEQLNVLQLTSREKFSHCSKDEFDMIIDNALKFSVNSLLPINKEGDEIGAVYKNGSVTLPKSFKKAMKEYGDAGWVCMADDMEMGGHGLPMGIYCVAIELFFASNSSLTLCPMLTHGAAKMIELFGSDEQRKKYMEKMYTFEWSGTMCLTENHAGSDLAHVTTKAVKIDEKHYKISGQKIFISGGDQDAKSNIIHTVLARIEGDPKGIKGISLFIVPKYRINEDGSIGESNDVSCAGIEHKMGIKASSTAQLHFGDNNECIGELLGEPRQGIVYMFHMMNEERFNMGVQGLGISSAAYLTALDYCRKRLQGTDITRKGHSTDLIPIIKHPDVRRTLLWMKSYVEGLRALNYYTAYYMDMANSEKDAEQKALYDGIVAFMIPVCKAYSTDMVYDICEQAIQLLGGYGYCSSYPVEQYARDSKIASIYEGANGIQAIDLLGRKLPMNEGKIFDYLMNQIEETVIEALKDKQLKRYAHIVLRAKTDLIEAAYHLKTLIRHGSMHEAYLNATPFLEVVGDTILGWMHLWQLMIAHKKISEIHIEKNVQNGSDKKDINKANKEAAFYSGKVHSAKYFIIKILPVTRAKVDAILNEDIDALEMDDISFGEEMQQ